MSSISQKTQYRLNLIKNVFLNNFIIFINKTLHSLVTLVAIQAFDDHM